MAEWDFALVPSHVQVEFALNPVPVVINSMLLLREQEVSSGLAPWVNDTAKRLTDEEKTDLDEIATAMVFIFSPNESRSFPDFLAHLRLSEPEFFRNAFTRWMMKEPNFTHFDEIMQSEETFLQFVRESYGEDPDEDSSLITTEKYRHFYAQLQQPDQLQERVIKTISGLWDKYLKPEWERSKASLLQSTQAFSQLDFSGMSAYEAIENVTGRNLRSNEKLARSIDRVTRIVFMPSPHLGPYISWITAGDESELVLLYGARIPRGTPSRSAELSRSELLVRLSALADDTRLRILALLAQNEEMCAQDFINELDLSQSGASRHLRQLTASGFITERRRDIAKCYSLNPDRIEDTMQTLQRFLSSGR